MTFREPVDQFKNLRGFSTDWEDHPMKADLENGHARAQKYAMLEGVFDLGLDDHIQLLEAGAPGHADGYRLGRPAEGGRLSAGKANSAVDQIRDHIVGSEVAIPPDNFADTAENQDDDALLVGLRRVR
jgi:hypothetical protein